MMAIQREKERNVQTFILWIENGYISRECVECLHVERTGLHSTIVKGKYVLLGRLIDQMINEMMDLDTNPKYHTSVSE